MTVASRGMGREDHHGSYREQAELKKSLVPGTDGAECSSTDRSRSLPWPYKKLARWLDRRSWMRPTPPPGRACHRSRRTIPPIEVPAAAVSTFLGRRKRPVHPAASYP